MTKTYVAMVEHQRGKQITRIDARDQMTAEHRLKAIGYTVIWCTLDD